jgi:hypothetical protein
VSVALKVGTVPEIALLLRSLMVIVTVDVATPLARTGEVPVKVEFAATAGPGLKTTDPSVFTTGVAMDKILVSAFVDANVQVEIPEASVEEHAVIVLVDPVSVAVNVGIIPDTGLFEISLRVTVTVEVAAPSATTGLVPVIVEFAATAEAAVKITVPSALATGVAIDNVFVSAFNELRVQVATPEALVEEQTP